MQGGKGNVWSSCTQNANLVTDTGEGETGQRGAEPEGGKGRQY